MTDCSDWAVELVERARAGVPAGAELTAHMSVCPACAARWETQREVSWRLRQIREAVPVADPSGGRDRILAQFQWQRRRSVRRRAATSTLAWAAVFVLALLVQRPWHKPGSHGFPTAAEMSPPEWNEVEVLEEMSETDTGDSAEFLSVPYTPPLAAGEFTRVERMELSGAALVRMGFAAETTSENALSADVVVGEDGLPRAVRFQERDIQY